MPLYQEACYDIASLVYQIRWYFSGKETAQISKGNETMDKNIKISF